MCHVNLDSTPTNKENPLPNNEPVTYDQLKAMMEVQSKNTEQMVLVADRLKNIDENEKSIIEKATASEDNKKTLVEIKATITDIASKTNFLLIIYTALTGLVAVAFLIVQVVNWSSSNKSKEEQNIYLKKIQQEGVLRGDLQAQIKAEVEKLHSEKSK